MVTEVNGINAGMVIHDTRNADKKNKQNKSDEINVMDNISERNDESDISLKHYPTKYKHYIDITQVDLSKGSIPYDRKILDRKKIESIKSELDECSGCLSANSDTLCLIAKTRFPETKLEDLTDEQIGILNKEIISGKYNELIEKYKKVDFNENLLIDETKSYLINSDGEIPLAKIQQLYKITIDKLKKEEPLNDDEKIIYALILNEKPLEKLPKTEEKEKVLIERISKNIENLRQKEKNISVSTKINSITSKAADKLLFDNIAPILKNIENDIKTNMTENQAKLSLFAHMVDVWRSDKRPKEQTVTMYYNNLGVNTPVTFNLGSNEPIIESFEEKTLKNLKAIDDALKIRQDAKQLYKLVTGREFNIQEYKLLVQKEIAYKKNEHTGREISKISDIFEQNKNFSDLSQSEQEALLNFIDTFMPDTGLKGYFMLPKSTPKDKQDELDVLSECTKILDEIYKETLEASKNQKKQFEASLENFFDYNDGQGLNAVKDYLTTMQKRGNMVLGGYSSIAFAAMLLGGEILAGEAMVGASGCEIWGGLETTKASTAAILAKSSLASKIMPLAGKIANSTLVTKITPIAKTFANSKTGAALGRATSIAAITSIPSAADIILRSKIDKDFDKVSLVHKDEFKNLGLQVSASFAGSLMLTGLQPFAKTLAAKATPVISTSLDKTGNALIELGSNNSIAPSSKIVRFVANSATNTGNVLISPEAKFITVRGLTSGTCMSVPSTLIGGAYGLYATGDPIESLKIAGKSGGVSFLYGVGYGSIGAAINLYSDVPAPKGGVQKETKVVGTDSSGSKLTATSWLDKDGERMGVTDFKVDNEKFAKYIIKTISDKDCKFIKNLLGSQPPAKPSASTVREVNPSLLPTQYSTAVVKNNQGVNTKTSNTFIPRIVFEPNRHKTLRVFSGIENLPDGKTRPVISGAEYYFGNLKIRQLGIPQDNKFK